MTDTAVASGIRLAEDLTLPDELVTRMIAILAIRGAGKSYTGMVLAEEFLDRQLQVVILDPMGVWWGLRSDADGSGDGYPIVILGGEHGDVDLEPTAGAALADVVAHQRLSCILDLSGFTSNAQQQRFVTDFAERLYRAKAPEKYRTPLNLMCDEADCFVPQRPQPGEARMLGAFETLARRARVRGIGLTLISQRAAVVNKNALTQADLLLALRTIGKQDRNAIEEWVRVHGSPEQQAEMFGGIASLPSGTAWAWWPDADIFRRVGIRRRRTFDSSATPKPGEQRIVPSDRAAVDLDHLRRVIAETVPEAKLPDIPKGDSKLVAALQESNARLVIQVEELREDVRLRNQRIAEMASRLRESATWLTGPYEDTMYPPAGLGINGEVVVPLSDMPIRLNPRTIPAPRRRMPPRSTPEERAAVRREGVSGPQQRILDTLAWFESVRIPAPTKAQVALFAGVSPRSGGYRNNLSALRTAGLVDYPGNDLALTEAGRAAAAPAPELSDAAMHEALYGRLPGPQARMLRWLIDIYPAHASKEVLARELAVAPTSGGYRNNLSALRSLGLIDYPQPGMVCAQPVLFTERR